jgi:hypothetical protein
VRHFELELTNGVAVSRRRLETRFIVKNAGGIYGLTYRGDDAQTNATQVSEEGRDEVFEIPEPGGVRLQTWHYPSREDRVRSCLAVNSQDATEKRFIPNYAAGESYSLWSTRTDLEALGGLSLQVQEAGFKASLPVFRNDHTLLTAGVNLRWNELDFEATTIVAERLDLYRVQLPVDVWHSFNDRWKAWGRVEPGLFTDFENVEGDAFGVTVLALASYQFTPEFSAAFGVY